MKDGEQFIFIKFVFLSCEQIFEWCQYVKMSGKMTRKLPLQLPSEGVELPLHDNSKGERHDLSSELVASMEQVYMDVVPEFQSLVALYNMEREIAHNQRRLKKFPKLLIGDQRGVTHKPQSRA